MTLRNFELFVAGRYLRAKRKQTVLSLVTGISIVGVAAGVMALIVALAINNGFRSTLQRNLLGATAHVSVLEKEPGYGIDNWRDLTKRLRALPHVTAASPVLYGTIFLAGGANSSGAVLKGIQPESETKTADVLSHVKPDVLARLDNARGYPGIILGARLAQSTGALQDSLVTVISPQGELTPFGPRPSYHRFRVVGTFETGFFELDNAWAYTSLKSAQQTFALEDVVNSIEMKLDDIERAPELAREAERLSGPKLAATHWQEQNKPLMNALRMERIVTVITIGLIQLVAALNILITLTMMVMEKHRDIAVMMSMGARREQIRNVFVLQGMLIGVVGAVIGLFLGYSVCFLADHYRLIQLDEAVYSLSYVPFEPRWFDGLWVPLTAILISFVATLYPARNATRIVPVEALRYE